MHPRPEKLCRRHPSAHRASSRVLDGARTVGSPVPPVAPSRDLGRKDQANHLTTRGHRGARARSGPRESRHGRVVPRGAVRRPATAALVFLGLSRLGAHARHTFSTPTRMTRMIRMASMRTRRLERSANRSVRCGLTGTFGRSAPIGRDGTRREGRAEAHDMVPPSRRDLRMTTKARSSAFLRNEKL